MQLSPPRARGARLTALSATLVLALTACGTGGGASSGSSTTAGSDATTASASTSASGSAAAESDKKVTLYSGRSEDLVQPILDKFTEETGIEVEVRYDKTPAMAAQIIEEGEGSPAEVFLAQDAGALGAVAKEGMFVPVDQASLDRVPQTYRDDDGNWVGLTGRVRVLAYNKHKVAEADLPEHVAELTGEDWTGRVGVAPTNASFQTFVTALRLELGEDGARQWLEDFAANDPQRREKNGEILADVDAGTLDAGLINHYYLVELAKEKGVKPEELDAALHFFPDGDLGSLVNVSGMGLVGEQEDADGAKLIEYLLSEDGQTYFAQETGEYPLVDGVEPPAGFPELDEIQAPDVDLNDLDDLQTTIEMIQEAGLL